MKKNFRRHQRGVVLLVVLSLLTLFTLLMVTFIIVAGQYRQSALSAARVSRVEASPTKLLDNATFALLRDSNDPKNTIRFHSLLFDMWGGDGFVGVASGVSDVTDSTGTPNDGTGGNFFDLRIAVGPVASPNTPQDLAGNYHPLSYVDGYYNGCVITIVSSSVAQGRRFRVVDYIAHPLGPTPTPPYPLPVQHKFRLMPIAMSPESSNVRPVAGDRVLLNGRPFNGTGFGYDSTASSTSPKLNPAYALQPNQLGQTNATQLANFVSGDADESYDAVDFQNMALAGIIPVADTTIAPDGLVVIPSFHRPELVNYWFATDATQLARAIMRPMPWDHPNFDGSNRELTLPPGFTAAQRDQFLSKLAGVDPLIPTKRINPWDVDNDGDRVPDSIWVDLGFPVQTTADGRQVRPLFAFLCTDLDGRINLNTAGSAGHINGLLARNATTTLARSAVSSSLSTGQGLGPAEINPGYDTVNSYPLFRNANSTDQYFAMLSSRYGANQLPGVNGMDTFASVKLFEFPTNYFYGTTGKAYNSPVDVFGELAIGLDYRGQPTYDTPNISRTDLLTSSPYEFDVTGLQRGRADNPFTVAELERILRFNDAASGQLPGRLAGLAGVPGDASRRRSVTTDSFDVPVPPVLSLPELRSGFAATTDWQTQFPSYNSGRPLHVTDLLAIRLVNGGVLQANINSEIANMLSFELRAGTRMDVNRPFGNGQDDNGNGVVDEHGPTSAQQLEADPSVPEQVWAAGTNFDHDNDGNTTTDTNAFLARYHFAKHLYVLAATLKDIGFEFDLDGIDRGPDPGLADMDPDTAESLAQWAINVIDFRDADSIMTAFEYDLNPFNGWDVDGHLTTDDSTFGGDGIDNDGDSSVDEQDEQDRAARAAVDRPPTPAWGCERPELLISETLAFHDRRTEDLTPKTDDPTPDANGNFDQRLRPRGSLFIELYNPWTGFNRPPAELYTTAGAMVAAGVDLRRRAPISTATGAPLTGAPVWRMIVVTGASHNGGVSPLDPDEPLSGFSTSDVERGIYFVDPTATVPAIPGEVRHFSTLAMAPLEPGRFAVVGSGISDGAGNYVTTLGRRTDAEDDGQTSGTTNLLTGTTRRIVLTPNASASTQQVQLLDNPGSNTPPLTSIQPAIAAVINNGGNLNISEPPLGYPAGANWDPAAASGEGAYISPNEDPYDAMVLGRSADIVDVLDDVAPTNDPGAPDPGNRNRSSVGPYSSGVCTVHLQRLANPLFPYDPTSNPYRSIDNASIDLTVFEGVFDPANTLPTPRTNPDMAGDPVEPFGGRERGVTGVTPPPNRLWSSKVTETTAATANPAGGGDSQVFNYLLDSTLGYSNDTFGSRFNTTDGVPAEYVGAPRTTTAGTDGEPFPWLTWNNRPFVSQHEMMLVPHTRSSQLLRQYSTANTTADIYQASEPRQFDHLLNFFATTYFDPIGMSPPTPGPNLYRLFDYTHVPSRFMGTETWLNATTFASGNGTELLHPPFDRVFSFREPGKPNINTIFEERVWDAIRGPNTTLPDFDSLVDSRRGYGTATDTAITLYTTVPTFFGNPFRAPDAGDLVPEYEPVPPPMTPPPQPMLRAGVEATLLRSPALIASTTQAEEDGQFAVIAGGAHVDPNRNPYFRYQNMQRLSNLVTTRSNVYAIWVTMGMFEVTVEETAPSSGVFVERLGQEAGRETGSVKRHRGFYIVDRSIPVAFQPGENHNVDQAILLRRIIE